MRERGGIRRADTGVRLILASALAGMLVAGAAQGEEAWLGQAVPGVLSKQRQEQVAENGGFCWYRCFVRVPARWASGKGKLWSDSVTLTLSELGHAHEVYINGKRIGGAGRFPPDARRPDAGYHRYKVPAGTLVKDQFNVVALRVHVTDGRMGLARGPVIAGYHDECVLRGDWQWRAGDDRSWAAASLAGRPAGSVFERFRAATSALQPAAPLVVERGLPPAESLEKFTVAKDLVVEQVLSEPHVAQPLFLSFDERGRLWVVEYRQYPYPAGLKMVSRDKYYRAVYDRVSPPPPRHFRGRDRITIHEDSNGDGKLDRHRTFLDGLSIVTSLAHGRGGVWVLNPPYLLFYPDADRDDRPDGDPVVHLSGFGLEDTHSVTNSLRWGPDGWLYATHGSTVSSHVRVTGRTDRPTYIEGQGVWRYHPEQRRFEVFAHGGGNAFGLEIDSAGRTFSGHNGGNTRGFHYVQGGYTARNKTGKYGPPPNSYAFGDLPAMAHAPVARFTHNFVVYESTELPAAYRGRMFCIDPLHRRVALAERIAQGSTYRTKDRGFPLSSTDAAFRPVDIKLGPDGAIYVADFYETYIAHGQHFQGQIDANSGRVYRLRSVGGSPLKSNDLGARSTAELIGLLEHPNRWFRQTAQRLLADRRDRSAVPDLRARLKQKTDQLALEALWALHTSGAWDEQTARTAMDHTTPSVRAWAVRLLGDGDKISTETAEAMQSLAAKEADVQVRSQLACTAKRLAAEQALPIIQALLVRDDDVDDLHIPLLLWWAIEAHCADHAGPVLSLFDEPEIWKSRTVEKHILPRVMRRFAVAGRRADLLACARLLETAPTAEARQALVRGFEQAFAGRSLPTLPDRLAAALARGGRDMLVLRLRGGDAAAVQQALKKIADEKMGADERISLIRALSETRAEGAPAAFLKLASSSRSAPVRQAAIGGLAAYDDAAIGEKMLAAWPGLPAEPRSAALSLLVSRPSWTLALMRAAKSGRIDAKLIDEETRRRAGLHQSKKIDALVAEVFAAGPGGEASATTEQIRRIRAVLAAGEGSPYEGRKLFLARCAACHRLFHDGGRIGPDLTSYQRDDLGTMLTSIVDPSAEIREGFEYVVVHTTDGRAISGFLVDQDTKIVALRDTAGLTHRLERRLVKRMAPMGRSLMPAGLLTGLGDPQIRSLFAYLRAGQPLNQ